MKKKIALVALILLGVLGGSIAGYTWGTTYEQATKQSSEKQEKKQATKQKTEEIQGNTTSNTHIVNSEEQEKKQAILAINEKVVHAYFEYTSTETMMKQVLAVSSQDFQGKIKEASGASGEAIKSHLVSVQTFVDMTSVFHPEVVNLVTNRIAVNGQTYQQTSYARYQFTNEENEWKLASVALTPIQDTQKVQ
ncbi:hypothetical protein [Listeria sp. ILCC797]|uniref:hypothetical protein n=1 Tax=Listeria sp. ILCC797 TaxID=1918333 RepID=UPI000B588921|nr:hypothetical protein [Listeria sp. ILCC797]